MRTTTTSCLDPVVMIRAALNGIGSRHALALRRVTEICFHLAGAKQEHSVAPSFARILARPPTVNAASAKSPFSQRRSSESSHLFVPGPNRQHPACCAIPPAPDRHFASAPAAPPARARAVPGIHTHAPLPRPVLAETSLDYLTSQCAGCGFQMRVASRIYQRPAGLPVGIGGRSYIQDVTIHSEHVATPPEIQQTILSQADSMVHFAVTVRSRRLRRSVSQSRRTPACRAPCIPHPSHPRSRSWNASQAARGQCPAC